MRTVVTAMTLCLWAPMACRTADAPAPGDAKTGAAPAKPEAAAPLPDTERQPDAKPDDETEPTTPASAGLVGKLEEARVKTACTELNMLRNAVEMFTALKGACPSDLATLETERVIDRLRDDPWGHAYTLRCEELQVRSAGPDGEAGTPDDVVLGATGDACSAG